MSNDLVKEGYQPSEADYFIKSELGTSRCLENKV